MKRTRPWELSDEIWERVRPLIPERPAHPKGGRPARDDRQMLAAILYVLRTGIQWNALPRELGASTTVYDRFRLWEQQGVFDRIWQAGLQEYDELEGIAWEWQSMDGVMTKAPFGGAATGANPTDRGKRGTKRSQLSDGRGIPLALVIDGANRHDMKLAETTLDHLMIARPTPTEEMPQHLCLDAGYDYDAVSETVRTHQYVPHIRPTLHTRAHARARGGAQQQSGVHKAASSLGGRALALLAQSLAALVGALGEAGGDLSSFLASGLWSHLLSTL